MSRPVWSATVLFVLSRPLDAPVSGRATARAGVKVARELAELRLGKRSRSSTSTAPVRRTRVASRKFVPTDRSDGVPTRVRAVGEAHESGEPRRVEALRNGALSGASRSRRCVTVFIDVLSVCYGTRFPGTEAKCAPRSMVARRSSALMFCVPGGTHAVVDGHGRVEFPGVDTPQGTTSTTAALRSSLRCGQGV